MKAAIYLGAAALLWALSAAVCARDLQADYSALVAAQTEAMSKSEQDAAKLIEASYLDRFEAVALGNIEKLPSNDIDILFRAANTAAGYTFERTYVLQMKKAYDALSTRGALGERYPLNMLEAFVAARMLDDAKRFAAEDSNLDTTLPVFREEGSSAGVPTLWSIHDEGKTLVHHAADLTHPMVVVVSHPLCSFSQAAATEIAKDDDLRKHFARPSIWLLPQTAMFDTEQALTWEKAHTPFSMAYANTQREWPMIDSWETPTFYFLKNGKVVHKVVGWPKEGRKAELLEGLAKIAVP